MIRRDEKIERPDRGLTEGWLLFAVESLVIGAIYVGTLRNDPHLREPPRLVLLTVLITAHLVLLWLSAVLFQKRPRLVSVYFVVKAILAFVVGLLTPGYWLAIAVLRHISFWEKRRLMPNL